MELNRRRLLAAIGSSVALSGCIGDDAEPTDTPTDAMGGGATPTPTEAMGGGETPTESPTPTESSQGATVQVRDHPEHGEILVDDQGMTVYMFDSDTNGAGESTCSGDCASAWPAVTVSGDPTGGEGVTADLTTFERDDGEMQVAAAGWPLYYFVQDEEPGDANGQGIQDVWWVLRPDGTPVKPNSTATPSSSATVETRDHPEHGQILVDADGMSLYMFDNDTEGAGESSCAGGCAENWPPLTVDEEPKAGSGVTASLSTFERDDGKMQVAAGGWPLYYFVQDEEPGDTNGQGVQDVWWVLDPGGNPIKGNNMGSGY